MVAHLSALIGIIIGVSFVGPLIVMLVQGPKSRFVREQAVEALNFNITVLIAVLVSSLLIFLLIGLILLPIVLIAWLVFTIIGDVTANDGRPYRYPINIRMVKRSDGRHALPGRTSPGLVAMSTQPGQST